MPAGNASKIGIKNGIFFQKKIIIGRIFEVIRENEGLKVDCLIAKLNVNDPFLNEKSAETYVKNLFKDKQIIINKNDEVSICKTK